LGQNNVRKSSSLMREVNRWEEKEKGLGRIIGEKGQRSECGGSQHEGNCLERREGIF